MLLLWWRDRHIDQWNRIKKLEIDPYKYFQPMFDKGKKAIQMKKEYPFQEMVIE